MKISGSATLAAPVETVFAALNDPAVLVRTIPGCERLEEVGEGRYRMTVTAGVASIKGSYDGEVALTDQQPPSAFTLRATGAGAPGTLSADVAVRLLGEGDGTRLEYDADAVVGGMIGGVGQRMLTGVARKTAGEFFAAVDSMLLAGPGALAPAPAASGPEARVEQAGAPAAEAVAAGAPGARVFTAPAREVSPGLPWWAVLAGFGAGAFWALTGVVVGFRLARRRGR